MPPPYECPTRSTFSRPSASSHSPPAWARASDPPPNTDRAGHNAPPTSPPTAACDPDPGRSPAATRPPACDAPPPDEAPPPASPSTLLTLDQHERTSVKAPTDGTMCLRLNAQSGERCSCGQRGTMFLRPSARQPAGPDPELRSARQPSAAIRSALALPTRRTRLAIRTAEAPPLEPAD